MGGSKPNVIELTPHIVTVADAHLLVRFTVFAVHRDETLHIEQRLIAAVVSSREQEVADATEMSRGTNPKR